VNSFIFFEIGGNWLIREIGLGETSWAFRFIDRQALIMTRMHFVCVCVTHFQFWSNYKSIVEIKKRPWGRLTSSWIFDRFSKIASQKNLTRDTHTRNSSSLFSVFFLFSFLSSIFYFIIFPPAHALAPSWLFRRDFFFFFFFLDFLIFFFVLHYFIFSFLFFFFFEGRIVFPPLSIPPVRPGLSIWAMTGTKKIYIYK
jgi:hypothetical protein